MDRITLIGLRIVADTFDDLLLSNVPRDIVNVLKRFPSSVKEKVIDAVLGKKTLFLKLQTSHGGSPVRNGWEKGWMLGINDPIREHREQDPGKTEIIGYPSINDFEGNKFYFAPYDFEWFEVE